MVRGEWRRGGGIKRPTGEPDNGPFEAYINNPQHVARTELITDIHLPLKTP
jgi:hypothetical protein